MSGYDDMIRDGRLIAARMRILASLRDRRYRLETKQPSGHACIAYSPALPDLAAMDAYDEAAHRIIQAGAACGYWGDWGTCLALLMGKAVNLNASHQRSRQLDDAQVTLSYVCAWLGTKTTIPPSPPYAGVCKACGKSIYDERLAGHVACPACQSDNDLVDVRRQAEADYLRMEIQGSSRQVCAWIADQTGIKIKPGTLRQWCKRGKVKPWYDSQQMQTVWNVSQILSAATGKEAK